MRVLVFLYGFIKLQSKTVHRILDPFFHDFLEAAIVFDVLRVLVYVFLQLLILGCQPLIIALDRVQCRQLVL